MRTRRLAAIVLAAAALARADGPAPTPSEPPRDLGLRERASVRLSQFDVSISGPAEAIRDLRPEDFEISLDARRLKGFLVDAMCDGGEVPTARIVERGRIAGAAPDAPAEPPPPGLGPATFLFYFDQAHLTMAGRSNAMGIARDLIPKLIKNGNRAMILSNARTLNTVQALSSDPQQILRAIDRLDKSRDDWDPYAAQEDTRLLEVQEALQRDIKRAQWLARIYQQEERFRQTRDLQRLSMVLGRLAEMDSPKAVIYFADTMRKNAGEHYFSFFGRENLTEGMQMSGTAAAVAFDSQTAAFAMDKVVRDASAQGIRFYSVEPQGLFAGFPIDGKGTAASQGGGGVSVGGLQLSGGGNSPPPAMNLQRVRDAEDTLSTLSAETGGRAFIRDVDSDHVAERILDDLSCVYLVSFDPTGYAEDDALPLRVKVNRPKVRVHARGLLVIQSEASKLASRLLASFMAPEAVASDLPMRVGLFPIGYAKGIFEARLQLALPASPIPGMTWDIGASIVTGGKVRSETSGRIRVETPNVPVVLEKEMEFGEGAFEIIAVAHDTVTDQTVSRKIEGRWPDLQASVVSIAPIAVAQPVQGAFRRNGETKTSGNLHFEDGDPLDPSRPTAFFGLVCRATDRKAPFTVERVLEGETPTSFEPIRMELGEERCGQFRDVVPKGVMGPGSYVYRLRVADGETELASATRTFVVRGPATP